MSYHYTPIFGVGTWTDPMEEFKKELTKAQKTALDKERIETIAKFTAGVAAELRVDWSEMIDKAAIQSRVTDTSAFARSFPAPKVADLRDAEKAIAVTASALMDGKLDASEIKQIGTTLADAAGKLLSGAFATLGVAAGPIGVMAGLAIGALIGGLVDFFSDERAERSRALRREARARMDSIKAQAVAYETQIRDAAWKPIAGLSGDDEIVGVTYSGSRPLTSEEISRLEGYKKRCKELLKKFGFAPSSGDLEWNAILKEAQAGQWHYYDEHMCDRDYEKPRRGKNPYCQLPSDWHHMGTARRQKAFPAYDWAKEKMQPLALQASVDYFSELTQRRVRQDAAAMAILAAYTAQLRAVRDSTRGVVAAVKAAMKVAEFKLTDWGTMAKNLGQLKLGNLTPCSKDETYYTATKLCGKPGLSSPPKCGKDKLALNGRCVKPVVLPDITRESAVRCGKNEGKRFGKCVKCGKDEIVEKGKCVKCGKDEIVEKGKCVAKPSAAGWVWALGLAGLGGYLLYRRQNRRKRAV